MSGRVYRIIRFRRSGNNRTIRQGLTRAEAQAWCSRPDTRGGAGMRAWFDGFDYMRGCQPRPGDVDDPAPEGATVADAMNLNPQGRDE